MPLASFRTFSTMASGTGTGCSPFSLAVFSAMRKLYPEALADKSFDNTGLLLEAPFNPRSKLKNSVLLTIDLTTAVAQEAIDKKSSVVVTYHPIIFRGLKHLNLGNSQQKSLLRLAAEGISVYSPHTAVDAAEEGNADWMADIITGFVTQARGVNLPVSAESLESNSSFSVRNLPSGYHIYSFPGALSVNRTNFERRAYSHTRSVVTPNSRYPEAGMGRLVQFSEPRSLSGILEVITSYFLLPRAFSIACAYGQKVEDIMISSAGICAGSGGSVLSRLDDIDLIVTGEMSHHEALAAVESGKTVIIFGHSNSERGYLEAVMKDKLQRAVKEEWDTIREDGLMQLDGNGKEDMRATLENSEVDIEVSLKDRDPYQTAVWSGSIYSA